MSLITATNNVTLHDKNIVTVNVQPNKVHLNDLADTNAII